MDTSRLHRSLLRTSMLVAALGVGAALMAPVTAHATGASLPDSSAARAATGVAYLNGGIDTDNQEQMRKQAHDWPLRMTFSAQANNAFAANVALTILDQKSRPMLQLPSAGPLTYVRLSPGKYHITAEYQGTKQERDVQIGEQGSDVDFHWK